MQPDSTHRTPGLLDSLIPVTLVAAFYLGVYALFDPVGASRRFPDWVYDIGIVLLFAFSFGGALLYVFGTESSFAASFVALRRRLLVALAIVFPLLLMPLDLSTRGRAVAWALALVGHMAVLRFARRRHQAANPGVETDRDA